MHRASEAADAPAPFKKVQGDFVDVLGDTYRLPGPKDCVAFVLIFVGPDCPISNSYAKEVARLCKHYGPQKISFCVVYADAEISKAEAQRHAKQYGFPCPALLDPKMALALAAGATVVPEVAVVSSGGEVVYRGRIDDRYLDFGKRREQVTSHDLRSALDAVLAGAPVPVARTKAVGCPIDLPAGRK